MKGLLFISGALIGAGAALLLAPKKGEEYRQELSELGKVLCDKMMDKLAEKVEIDLELHKLDAEK
jgi:gas vesicle protein